MQARFVVAEQPSDCFIPGLAPGHEALPVQALDFQRAEQRLAAGIISAVATPVFFLQLLIYRLGEIWDRSFEQQR